MTVAWLDVTFDTLLTFAAAPDANGDVDCAAITFWNCDPFSSKATRCAVGVLDAKNFTQFASIVCSVGVVPEAAPEDGEDEAEAGDDDGLAFGAGGDELPHPAARRPDTATITGAREIRRVNGWRMVSVSLLRVILLRAE
ncbi:MAG TPA: hypothetical protein VGI74_00845 [Streptosporangiaceae bacterium]